MNRDPLLTGAPSVFPNENFSTVDTRWEEDTELAAREGLACSSGPMLTLWYRTSNRAFFANGAYNRCANDGQLGLVVMTSRIDRDTLPPAGPHLGPIGIAVMGVGGIGGAFFGGNRGLNLSGRGVWGRTSSDSNMAAGVWGDTSGAEAGVRGESAESTGVVGLSHGQDQSGIRSGPGVLGIGPPVTTPSALANSSWPGVLGMPSASNPRGNGVEGRSPAGFAGLFRGTVRVQGSVVVTGAKSAAVPHPDGSHRALYALESPDSWFEDFGRAEFSNGHAQR